MGGSVISVVGRAVASVVATVGVSGMAVGLAVTVTGACTVVGDVSADLAETVTAAAGRDIGAAVLSVAGLVVGTAVVTRIAGMVATVEGVGVRTVVRFAVEAGDTVAAACVRFGVGQETGVVVMPGVPVVAAGEGPPGRLRDGTGIGAAVGAGDTVVVTAVAEAGRGVAVGVTVAAVAAAVGSGVGAAVVSVSVGDAAGVPAPPADVSFVPPCMNAAISGGRTGAANPTTKSAMQATTPVPIRILKTRSPSIAPCGGRSRG